MSIVTLQDKGTINRVFTDLLIDSGFPDWALSSPLGDLLYNISKSNSDVFVYRPGGVASSNVYTDWSLLMADVDALQGLRTIQFDDSIVSPCIIPSGTWNMQDVILSGHYNVPVNVSINEGVVFSKLRVIQNFVNITFTGATPPVSDLENQGAILFNFGCNLTCTGSGPFIDQSTPGAFCSVGFINASSLITGTTPAVNVSAAGAALILFMLADTEVQNNTVSGIAGSLVGAFIGASSASFSELQPGFLGTLFPINLTRSRIYPTDVVNSGTPSPIVVESNSLLRCDPTGNIVVILPFALNTRGQSIIIKNVTSSIDSITITTQAGDTVDNSPTAIINSDHGILHFISDGISDWMVV